MFGTVYPRLNIMDPQAIFYGALHNSQETSTNTPMVTKLRSQQHGHRNTCILIDVLVSSKCCQPGKDPSKLKIETYLKRGVKPQAEKIHVVLQHMKFTDKLQMVPGYALFRASVNLSQYWIIDADEDLNIRYRYYVDGKKESYPKDGKKRRLCIRANQQDIAYHYNYPIYMYDELENTNRDVDSLIDDGKVSIAVRDAQLSFLTFLPHLMGRTSNYKPVLLDDMTIKIQQVVTSLCETGKINKRVPANFDHSKVLLHHLLSEINLPHTHSLYDLDVKHQMILVIRVCKLMNDNKLNVPPELQRKMCSHLLLPDMDKHEIVDLLKVIESSCPNAGSILQAFIQSMPDDCYEWLQLLPLVHFLRKGSEPFGGVLLHDENYRNLRFWGVHELNRQNARDTKNEESFRTVLKTSLHLFKVDPLLIRSCLWSQSTPRGILIMLEDEHIVEHIETPVLCRAMILATDCEQLSTQTQDLLELLDILLKRVASGKNINMYGFKKLTDNIIQKMKKIPPSKFQVVYKAIDVFLAAFTKKRVLEIAEGTTCPSAKTKECLEIVTALIGLWLQETLPEHPSSVDRKSFSTQYEPLVWETFFAFANIIEEEEHKQIWITQMSKHLRSRFWNKLSYTNILLVFCHDIDAQKYDALNEIAVNAVGELVKSMEEPIPNDFKCKMSEVFMKKYDELLQPVTLKGILSWPPFVVFFKLRAGDRSSEILSEECIPYLNNLWTLFESHSKDVITGSVTIEDLKRIVGNDALSKQFLELYTCQQDAVKRPPLVQEAGLQATVKKSLQCDRQHLEHLMNARKQEVKRLEIEREWNENLRRVCDDLGSVVDTSDVEEKLTRLSRQIRLDEVCTPTTVNSEPPHHIDTEESCFFKHSKEVHDMLQPLLSTFKSSLFQRAMQNKAKDVQHERKDREGSKSPLMTLTEMATDVWQPVYDSMKTFVDELRDGSIRLVKISDKLKHIRDEPKKLREEIKKVFYIYGWQGIRDVVETRCDQIMNYFQLRKYNQTAAKIMDLKAVLGLKGDFGEIQLLLEMSKREDQDGTLLGISEKTQKLCVRLENVETTNQLQYLENLSDEQSRKLLKWIRKAIDDLKELEVFVDLAAGDTDAEFATVLKFHHAVTGHAAFIFDLKETCDSKLFLDVLESLSSAYAKDTLLLSRWEDTKANLDRLIQIRKNMDSSPLQQAELINERGVYTIGKYELNKETSFSFSDIEITILLQFVKKHANELFGSRKPKSNKEKRRESIIKRREWKKAAEILRSSGGTEREWQIVQKKWRDLCRKAKEYESQKDESEDQEQFVKNPVYEKVLKILQVPEAEADRDKAGDDVSQTMRTDTSTSLILEVDIDGRKKIYTKDDLEDLQSKLSLVVGKVQQDSKHGDGKKQMDYFGEVFNAMQQLAKTYTNLCSAGNTLFLEWKATFRCDFKGDVDHTVCMDFGVDCKLYGTRSLREELPDLLGFMDKCLTRWKNHVDEKRNRYYYLNYFTTQQLLRLCHDLACQSRYPDRVHDYTQVFTLLSSVTHENSWKVIQASLKIAMSAATKEILQESKVVDDNDESQKDIQAAKRHEEQELATRLADENLMEDDTLVLAAIHALGTDKDDEEYITWCYNNPAGNKGEKPIHTVTKSWKEIVSELLSKLTKRESSLDVLLSELWENYLQSVKCVDSEEYLSLDYVGLILKHLAINASKATSSRIGWAIHSRSDTDTDGSTMVSPDQIFVCPGQVTSWRYQCKASHPFCAIVWRQVVDSATQFKVVGINNIPAATVGVPVTYQVPEDERISVQPGDMIGWSSGTSVLSCNTGGGYLVRWRTGDLHNGLNVDQIHNINSGVQDREYSIEATIERDKDWDDSDVFVYLKNRHRLASDFHTYFKESRPNLVICKQRDVFTTVLSLYRGSILPTQEEILICSRDTTVEQVSLLWRRAIADKSNQRLFCLVHAERLEYNVSVKCANLLHELTQKPTGCRLVVVCSLEEEQRAHMVTKLDQFRVELPPQVFSTKGIKQYLQDQCQQRAAIADIPDGNLPDIPGTYSAPNRVTEPNVPSEAAENHQDDGKDVVSTSEGIHRRRIVSSFLSFAESSILTLPCRLQQEAPRESARDLGSMANLPGGEKDFTGESEQEHCRQSTVQVIISRRSGVGKSTIVESYVEHLRAKHRVDPDAEMCITIPQHDMQVDNDAVLGMLLPYLKVDDLHFPRVFHFDIAPMVQDGLDDLLFNLLVLGGLVNKHGYAWKCQPTDIFIIEITELPSEDVKRPRLHTLLPNIECYGPQDVFKLLKRHQSQSDDSFSVSGLDLYGVTMNVDSKLFEPSVQCAYQYLDRYYNQQDLCNFSYKGDHPECSYVKILDILLQHCGVSDPSWAELQNFAHFLSAQLSDCEHSAFCQQVMIEINKSFTLFKSFVVELMMMMARDFSTPSLNMADVNPLSKPQSVSKPLSPSSVGSKTAIAVPLSSLPSERSSMSSMLSMEHSPLNENPADTSLVMEPDNEIDTSSEDSQPIELRFFQLKRRWEKSLHPYLFFNEDHDSFTFMGFILDEVGTLTPTGHAQQDPLTGGQVFATCYGWSLRRLLQALEDNGVNLTIDFDDLKREEKLLALYRVLGITLPEGLSIVEADPDKTYKLTADNVMKMLAIYMRFRCQIPVVIMGETGCGKTRLIQYLCQLLAKKGLGSIPQTSSSPSAASQSVDESETSTLGPETLSVGRTANADVRGRRAASEVENLVLMKVHGGTSMEDIIKKVERAEEIALLNQEKKINTILFLDEANTTEAVGLIKEIMCDRRVQGRPIETAGGNLQIIAACNPYRRHTSEMIARMKQSGLGYHVAADETKERFGSIPLRELVYRVQPIPPSIRPLVWDFGTLTAQVENVYIQQIVEDYNSSQRVRATSSERHVIVSILAGAQEFMRNEKNECSFVSLRDVTRCMDVLEWFLNVLPQKSEPEANGQSDESRYETRGLHDVEIVIPDDRRTSSHPHSSNVDPMDVLFESAGASTSSRNLKADFNSGHGTDTDPLQFEFEHFSESLQSFDSSSTLMSGNDTLFEISDSTSVNASSDNASELQVMSSLTRALVLALGVCYHARLQKGREQFRQNIAAMFQPPCILPEGPDQFLEVISNCQDEFLKDVDLGPNIAPNAALKENVFLMVICIELRIPLFLVGKPGSSKSLAKSIVSKAMQGAHSKSLLYKGLKQVHMLACQCSQLTTSDDILHAFERCSQFQKEKVTQNFVSVVVLDEVGLAEDSPKMPLKTLHPLLEPSTLGVEDNKFKKVGFIGLSNWALDPAKMNRGIMVSREDPTEKELIETARGICSADKEVLMNIQDLIPPLAKGYQEVCDKQSREFFGLRDYYSLIKMICGFATLSKTRPTCQEMEHCIKRNFDGFNEEIKPYRIFQQCLNDHNIKLADVQDGADQPDCSQGGLLTASMEGIPKVSDDTRDGLSVNRYLLVLTENFAALPIVEKQFADKEPEVIFGSSFPNDQEYTQVCRDINSIKICMEAGRTVILLNFKKLYESLYDALNLYYAHYKDKCYVALGLGTHRVKCKVDPKFRLIVIADKTDVYEHFPTPLINRLEKHFLSSSTMLTQTEHDLVVHLSQWVHEFSSITLPKDVEQCKFDVEDAFVGFHEDLIAKLVFRARDQRTEGDQPMENKRKKVKISLLQCSTPEAIMRLSYSKLKDDFKDLFDIYFSKQKHSSLKEYLHYHLQKSRRSQELMLQVTTHSRLLVSQDLEQLERDLRLEPKCLKSLYLHSFQTQQQCRQEVRNFLTSRQDCERILVVQCEDGHRNSQLIACASYCIVDEIMRTKDEASEIHPKPVHVIFVINLARMTTGFVSYHGGPWEMVHIDDVRPPQANRPEISSLMKLEGDIRSVFENPGEVNAERLLMDSLHRAISRIDVQSVDESDERKQISRRISTIRDLLDEDKNGTDNFISVMKKRIADVLKQRDEETGQQDVGMEWLMKKALEISSIHESGTFRRALWQQLINIVYPLLAEVIAFCDYHDNLQLLKTKENWIHSLWLAIFGDLVLAPLHFKDMISPTDSHSPPAVDVSPEVSAFHEYDHQQAQILQETTTGSQHAPPLRETIPVCVFSNSGNPFTASFPFSWLVKKHIDQRFEIAGEKQAIQKKHVLEDAVVAVKQHLGKLLDANIPSSEYQHCFDAYLKDFIHMNYTCGPKKDLQNMELECVTCAIKAAMVETKRRLDFDDERSPAKGLVLLHHTYKEITNRLQQFSKLVNACPDLLEKHFNQLGDQEGEMTLDVKAVALLVSEYLAPAKDECTRPMLQKTWLTKMQKVKLLVKSVIFCVTQNSVRVYGTESRRIIQEVRPKWHRIRILEMFFMNMFTSPHDVHQTICQMGLPVWNGFAGGANLKDIKTIKRVKNLLEKITKKAATIDFKYGLECAICISEATDPVFLECQHVFCERCLNELLSGGQRKCPTCKKPIGHSFQPEVTEADKKAFRRFQDFKERRNAFFFEIVSQLCFADKTPPDGNVVNGLLKLVVGRSTDAAQEEGVTFNTDCIDHTPAIRVVILRLLLQSSAEDTTRFLDEYLKDIKPATGEDLELASQVCLMFLYCFEDFWYRKATSTFDPKLTLIEEATKRLSNAKDGLSDLYLDQPQVPNVRTLKYIAEARFGLIVTSQFVHEISVDEDMLRKYKSLEYLFEAAQTLCLSTVCKQEAHLFLLKNLCKSFGTDALGQVSKHDQLKWILSEKLRELISKSKDMFVVLEDAYVDIRKGLYQSIKQESIGPLQQIYQSVECSASMRDTMVLLAIFRQVTLEYGSCADQASLQIKEAMQEFISTQTDNLRLQDMVTRLLENNLCSPKCNQLVVKPQDSEDRLRVVVLAIHTLVTVMCADGNSICSPLKLLIKKEKLNSKELAFVTAMIKRCTFPRDESSASELQPLIFNSIVRLLLLGTAVFNPNLAQKITKTKHNLGEYLWDTLDNNIKQLEAVAETRAGVYLIHVILARVTKYQYVEGDMSGSGVPNYEDWESIFIAECIDPIMQDQELELYRVTGVVEEDRTNIVMERHLQTSEPMLSLVDHQRFSDKFARLSEVWRYKLRISVDSVTSYIKRSGTNPRRYELLKEFFKMETVLRVMKDLSKILLLQRRLIERFHRCIDAKEAERLGPGDIGIGENKDEAAHDQALGESANDDEKVVYQLMVCFISVWNQVWPKMTLSVTQQQPLDIDRCNLSVFLPTASGISTQLTEFLIRTHNEFIDIYCRIRNQANEDKILPSSVTRTHLMAYDLDKELLPLIQAHCHHNFDEEVTSATFNLDSLERAIEETFIRGRPRIEGTLPQLMFREGSRSLRVFQEIRAKVKQERLSGPFKHDILDDLKSITDLCDCLAVVDIAIGFLVSTGGEPDTKIIDYLAESGINLPKEQITQIAAKARHRNLKHILDLWQLLGVERAKRRLASEKQDPFEGIPGQFQDRITPDESRVLSRNMRYVDVEEFISQLYEYIEINLKISNPDVETYDPQSVLFDEFQSYMKQKQFKMGGLQKAMKNMKKGGIELVVGKAVDTWKHAVKYQAGIVLKRSTCNW